MVSPMKKRKFVNSVSKESVTLVLKFLRYVIRCKRIVDRRFLESDSDFKACKYVSPVFPVTEQVHSKEL
ncbi:hypothetical protein QR98_0052970 [Sarcoptes scabiei]|uniref:Uncharacterized protein n=1 Tax=Sarcoptes scabiei TaxID=52283 RepID=A0A132A780_SARSC|nr:hypothetical protein QR98_0052970 [Sarcoptes scabiei]